MNFSYALVGGLVIRRAAINPGQHKTEQNFLKCAVYTQQRYLQKKL
jgi:hypothetical protein